MQSRKPSQIHNLDEKKCDDEEGGGVEGRRVSPAFHDPTGIIFQGRCITVAKPRSHMAMAIVGFPVHGNSIAIPIAVASRDVVTAFMATVAFEKLEQEVGGGLLHALLREGAAAHGMEGAVGADNPRAHEHVRHVAGACHHVGAGRVRP